MSFEDDMIEYGFTDAMTEAEEISEKQRQQKNQWSKNEYDYLSCHHISSMYIDELFDEGYLQKELQEKQKSKREKMERNWIISLWEKENPTKAKLWNAYFVQSLEINPEPLCWYSGRIGKKYILWKKWLEETEEYEEFKVKYPAKWKKLQERIYSSYIISAAKKWAKIDDFLDMDSFVTFDTYKRLHVWINSNILLWNNEIVPRYASLVNIERINPLKGWGKVYGWRNEFEVWKMKHPTLYAKEKKAWHNSTDNIYIWMKKNRDVWNNWKKNNFSLWSKCYTNYNNMLWYIYTENEWRKNLTTNEESKKTQKKDTAKILDDLWWDEELIGDIFSLDETYVDAYINKVEKSTHEKDLFVKTKCSEKGFEDFITRQKREQLSCWYPSSYDAAEVYADEIIMKLWIEKNNKKWNDWNFLYSWYNKYQSEAFHQFKLEDHYDTWKKLYPRKYKSWINKGYKEWSACKQKIEIWLLWLSDNNALIFDEWAKLNISNWEEEKDAVMTYDLSYAYHNLIGKQVFCDSLSFKNWRSNHPDEWVYWKDAIYDCLIKNRYQPTNQQKCKAKIEIDELRYRSQIGYRIFIEGMGIIEMDNKFGFFNETGEIVVPIIYDAVKEFHNGYAPVCTKESYIEHDDFWGDYSVEREFWKIVDKKGAFVIQSTYDKIEQITESFAVFVKDSCHGIVEFASGKEIMFPITYDCIRILDNGMWVARDNDYEKFGWAVLSQSGDNITSFKYSYIFNSDNDLTMVVKDAVLSNNNNGYIWGKWGYIDKEGNEVEELKEFDSPYSFEKYWIDNHKK